MIIYNYTIDMLLGWTFGPLFVMYEVIMKIYEIENYLSPIIEELGYELLDVEYKKKYNSMNLIVYIDKEDGITLDDCEIVHKAIDKPLDDLDPTKGASYMLNVSSPGLDRPLKKEKDYKRNLGKNIQVSFYYAHNGNKKLEGILESWTEDFISIRKSDNNIIKLDRKDISIIRPII